MFELIYGMLFGAAIYGVGFAVGRSEREHAEDLLEAARGGGGA